MVTKKISELAAGSAPDGTELIEAVQAGNSVSLTAQQIANLGGGGGGTMPGAAYAARLCALMEPDAIEPIQKDTFSYTVGAQTKYVLASWATRIGASGRSEVRNPQVPMAVNNTTISGNQVNAVAIILDPSVATYADPWGVYYARKLAIETLPTRTVAAPSNGGRVAFLPGAYGAIITQVTNYDYPWLILRIQNNYGPNLANEIDDTNSQRVGNALCLPVSKRIAGAIEAAPPAVTGQAGSVSFVLLPADWSVVPDPVSAVYDWRDDFMSSTLSATDWTIGTAGAGKVEIDATYQWCKLFGTNSWAGNAMLRKSGQVRTEGKALVFDVYVRDDGNQGWAALGWSNGGSTAGYANTSFAHCINFAGSKKLNVYEDGTNRGFVGAGWAADTPYRFRITLHADGSARYEIQGGAYAVIGGPSWTDITPATSSSSKNTVYVGAAAYSGTGWWSDPRVY